MPHASRTLRDDALSIWSAGVDAVDPEVLVSAYLRFEGRALGVGPSTLPVGPSGRIAVVGAGKAGAAMARGVEYALGASAVDARVHGLVAVHDDDVAPLHRIELVGTRGGHGNRPGAAGVAAARRIRDVAASLAPGDVLVALFSGGGSALLPAPVDGVTLAEKSEAITRLQDAGAPIGDVNTVRKHLSFLKGGRLAAAAPGVVVAGLLLSDVIGDAPDVIASGPTVPDPTTFADALRVFERFGVAAPDAVRTHLEEGAAGRHPETPPALPSSVFHHVVGNNQTAIDGASRRAESLGYTVLDLGSLDEPDPDRIAHLLAGLVASIRTGTTQFARPACIVCGGESVLALAPGAGRGGRNQDLTLRTARRLARELGRDGFEGVAVVCGGTDGEDGPTDAAGGVLDAGGAARLDDDAVADALARHDTYPLLERAGALLRTGRTGTNVADLRVVLIA